MPAALAAACSELRGIAAEKDVVRRAGLRLMVLRRRVDLRRRVRVPRLAILLAPFFAAFLRLGLRRAVELRRAGFLRRDDEVFFRADVFLVRRLAGRFFEVRFFEVRFFEGRFFEVRFFEVRFFEVRFFEVRFFAGARRTRRGLRFARTLRRRVRLPGFTTRSSTCAPFKVRMHPDYFDKNHTRCCRTRASGM
jgi:hypothetical protein